MGYLSSRITDNVDFAGLNNLYEYGLGGDPTNNPNWGTLPVFSKSGNRFIYMHPKGSDDDGPTYTVATITNQGYTVTGTNVAGEKLDFGTKDIDTVGSINFMRLRIEK